MDALLSMKFHPSSDQVRKSVHRRHPNISTGTIYNILDSFVSKGIVQRVKTDKGAMLYDIIADKHHHLYCADSDRIEDYYDPELDAYLENYFKSKGIRDFKVEDVRLQILGKFSASEK